MTETADDRTEAERLADKLRTVYDKYNTDGINDVDRAERINDRLRRFINNEAGWQLSHLDGAFLYLQMNRLQQERDAATREVEVLREEIGRLRTLLTHASDKLCHYATDYPQPDALSLINDCDRALARGHYSSGQLSADSASMALGPLPDDVCPDCGGPLDDNEECAFIRSQHEELQPVSDAALKTERAKVDATMDVVFGPLPDPATGAESIPDITAEEVGQPNANDAPDYPDPGPALNRALRRSSRLIGEAQPSADDVELTAARARLAAYQPGDYAPDDYEGPEVSGEIKHKRASADDVERAREGKTAAEMMRGVWRGWISRREEIVADTETVAAIARFGMSPEAQRMMREALSAARAQGEAKGRAEMRQVDPRLPSPPATASEDT